MKRMAIGEVWSIDLVSKGLDKRVRSVTFVRSMSSRLKIVVATEAQVAVLAPKDGSVETLMVVEEGLANQEKMKVFAI